MRSLRYLKFMIRTAAVLSLPLLLLVACETVETSKPRHLSSTRGLREETGLLGNKALVRSGDPKTLAKYEKVIIEDVRVIHPKRTENKVKPTTRAESERLAERFEEILREELRPHYQITNRRGRGTLAVRATLTDLQPSNPGVFVFNYLPYASAVTTGVSLATGKTPGAGSTSVEAEVVDSYSRRQVYAIVDRFKGSKLQPTGIDRWGQTESAMRAWSRRIRVGIQGSSARLSSAAASARTTSSKTTSAKTTSSRPASRGKEREEGKGGVLFARRKSE